MTLSGKTVLITDLTGSFGHKLARAALEGHGERRVVVFSRDELKQHEMRVAFDKDPRLTSLIGDVRDAPRLRRAGEADLDVVVHAAALKQVPACESNPCEATKTNILGAESVINAPIETGVPEVLALINQKAVNPMSHGL